MRYMRCKCGGATCWTTMGHPLCDYCPECHTTLAEGPDGHLPPEPHDWREQWKEGPGDVPPQKERVCLRCMKHEDITEANAKALTVWIDGAPKWMPSPYVMGKELKIARRIDPSFSLWRETAPPMQVQDDDKEILFEGDRFYSSPPGHF